MRNSIREIDLKFIYKQIIANAEAIKALYSRAQGEVSIREALHELDVWGATAVFSLTDYSDCRKVVVKLIKDWKDLTNKVKDMLKHYISQIDCI